MANPREVVSQTVQAVPPLGAIYIKIAEIPIEKWAAAGGLVLLMLQAAYLLWKWKNEREDRERARQYAPTVREPRDEREEYLGL